MVRGTELGRSVLGGTSPVVSLASAAFSVLSAER